MTSVLSGPDQFPRCFTSLKNRPKGIDWARITNFSDDYDAYGNAYDEGISSCGSECPDVRFNHEDFQCWNNDAASQTCYTKKSIVGNFNIKPAGTDWKVLGQHNPEDGTGWELQDPQNVCNADICQVQLTCDERLWDPSKLRRSCYYGMLW